MSCCRRDNGFHAQLKVRLEAKLEAVGVVFPKLVYASVIAADGDIIVKKETKSVSALPVDFAGNVAAFAKAAQSFAATLGQDDTSALHVRGESTMFNCYRVDDNFLVFYTMNESEEAAWDETMTDDAELAMRDILTDMKLLLSSLFVPAVNNNKPTVTL
jgi:predicted regulator of Ras-like GTPase activity (Roadblock/LC7/MglB family)